MTTTSPSRTLRVARADGGARLDRFVQARCPDLSRSRGAALVREGKVTVNGARAKPSSIVNDGDTVVVTVPPPTPTDLVAQDIPIHVVYEDAHMLVVDKPAGLTVHPAPGHPDGTLVNALLAMIPDLPGIGGEMRPGIVHRLDKDTSGLMMVAKNDIAHRSLTRQLKDREVHKTYLALVVGTLKDDEGVIDGAIGRHPKARKRMAIVEGGRASRTEYRVVRRFGHGAASLDGGALRTGATLVEAHPVTGRTHQIRVHFTSLGHPLVGDQVYGRRSSLVDRHFLHAARLAFHLPPDEREWREFAVALPPDLQAALDALEALA